MHLPTTALAVLLLASSTRALEKEKPPDAEALAARLCQALHGLPAQRRAECCGVAANSLAAVCARELAGALDRGAASVDPEAIDRCAAQAAGDLAGCSWITPVPPPIPGACRGLVVGRLAADQACQSSLECIAGLYCQGLSPSSPGVCRPPAAARQRCQEPADNLAVYTGGKDDPRHPACDGVCVRGVCLPRAAAGEACSSPNQCRSGLQCRAGQCEASAPPRPGEACTGRGPCAAGAYCDGSRCLPLKEAGEACTLAFECRATSCEMAPGAKAGRCGSPCGPTASRR